MIAFLWIRHHGFFRVLDRIDAKLTVLNLTYLAFVAFMPYPTRVLGLYGDQTSSVMLYTQRPERSWRRSPLMQVHAQRAQLLSQLATRA